MKRRGKVNFLPLGMEGRFLEVVDFRKEDLDEMREPSVPIGIGRPIIRSEHCRHRDRIDPLPLFYEVGIVLVIQLRRQIVGRSAFAYSTGTRWRLSSLICVVAFDGLPCTAITASSSPFLSFSSAIRCSM